MTRTTKICLLLSLVMALGIGAAVAAQYQRGLALRAELEAMRSQNAEVARLRAANQQVRAQQISPDELNSLRTDHTLVAQLRDQLDSLQKSSGSSSVAADRSESNPAPLVAADWRNAGQATPQAALETALWAATTGDVAALTGTFEFSEGGKIKAQALFDSLGDDVKSRYQSPQQLMALLAARATNFTAVTVLRQMGDPQSQNVEVELQSPDGTRRKTNLIMKATGDTWHLVMTESTIDGYARQLKSGPSLPKS